MIDCKRLVEVKGIKEGSGFLITERLVLTACHLLRDADGALIPNVRIRLEGDIERGQEPKAYRIAQLLWPKNDLGEDMDAALLGIASAGADFTADDRGVSEPAIRWGYWEKSSRIEVETIGYPDISVDRLLNRREPKGVTGWMQLADNYRSLKDGRGTLSMTFSDEEAPAPKSIDPWPAMSGAAVFSQSLLVGIVTRVEPQRDRYRFRVLPISRVFGNSEVREAIHKAGYDFPRGVNLFATIGDLNALSVAINEVISHGLVSQPDLTTLAIRTGMSEEVALSLLRNIKPSAAPEDLLAKFKDIAGTYQSLLKHLKMLSTAHACARSSIDHALKMLLHGSSGKDYDVAAESLKDAETECPESLAKAAISAARSELELVRCNYLMAYQHLNSAYTLVVDVDPTLGCIYLFRAANLLRYHGDEKGDNAILAQALEVYERVLEKSRLISDPATLAEIRSSYWNTLQTIGEREDGIDRLEATLDANCAVLNTYDRKAMPLEWAMTQNNIGNALLAVGERSIEMQLIERAVRAYQHALKVYQGAKKPLREAAVLNNLGTALYVLAERESGTTVFADAGGKHVTRSILVLRKAAALYKREEQPIDWAMVQNNLGNALAISGETTGRLRKVAQAVPLFNAVLEEYARECMPLHWAGVRNNLGRALQFLAEREGETKQLEAAEAAYKEALAKNPRGRAPLDWAMMQNNLGNTLRALAGREQNPQALLHMSVRAFREALKEFTPDRCPLQCGVTRSNVGKALITLAKAENQVGLLAEARSVLESARNIFRHAGMDLYADASQDYLNELDGHATSESHLRSLSGSQISSGTSDVTSRFWVLRGTTDDLSRR